MEIKREDISQDPHTGKLATRLALKLVDGNGMMLKAKAELYASIMDGVSDLIEAKIAEFAEKYGEEVVKFAHGMEAVDLRDVEPPVKFVDSEEISRRLLGKAFKTNPRYETPHFTWKEFKRQVEAAGITDATEVMYIDWDDGHDVQVDSSRTSKFCIIT